MPETTKVSLTETVLDPTRALVPVQLKTNTQTVEAGFWPKVRHLATKLPFAQSLVALWYCARDPKTPARSKALVLAGLAYFVLPTDAVPDVFVGIGFSDDAAVIAALVSLIGAHLKPEHYALARTRLASFVHGDTKR
ncbi:MAG: YkvA family protein [Asticcacaulis sp.]